MEVKPGKYFVAISNSKKIYVLDKSNEEGEAKIEEINNPSDRNIN